MIARMLGAARGLFVVGLTAAMALPALASGQGVAYRVIDYKGSLSDCQLAASVAFNNSGFKNVSTVKSKNFPNGAVFADVGLYQGTIICDHAHKAATIVVVGSVQQKTLDLTQAITKAFPE